MLIIIWMSFVVDVTEATVDTFELIAFSVRCKLALRGVCVCAHVFSLHFHSDGGQFGRSSGEGVCHGQLTLFGSGRMVMVKLIAPSVLRTHAQNVSTQSDGCERKWVAARAPWLITPKFLFASAQQLCRISQQINYRLAVALTAPKHRYVCAPNAPKQIEWSLLRMSHNCYQNSTQWWNGMPRCHHRSRADCVRECVCVCMSRGSAVLIIDSLEIYESRTIVVMSPTAHTHTMAHANVRRTREHHKNDIMYCNRSNENEMRTTAMVPKSAGSNEEREKEREGAMHVH